MRSIDSSFYKTKAWKDCAEAYRIEKKFLCEDCLKRGIYTPAVTVHHIEHLNEMNIHRPEIAYGFDNLKLVCTNCHAEEHSKRKKERRFTVDSWGRVTSR